MLLLLLVSLTSAEDRRIHSVVVKSCSGWRAQDGPEIKSFVEEDLETLYARTEYKFVCKPGVGPVALFKDQEGELVETVQLEGMKRSELNQLMISKGIPLASSHTEL